MALVKCFGCDIAILINDKDSLIPAEHRLIMCSECWKDDFKREAMLNYDVNQLKKKN